MFAIRSPHSICIWESENAHDCTFCAISVEKMCGSFFFAECTMTGVAYLGKLASDCYASLYKTGISSSFDSWMGLCAL